MSGRAEWYAARRTARSATLLRGEPGDGEEGRMKRLIIAGGLASLVAWAGAPAQAGQQTQDTKGKTVTLTGCLAKGDTAGSFMLNKATMGGDKGAASGTAGGSGAAGGASGSGAAGGASGSGAAGGASGSGAAGGASGSGAAGSASGAGQGATYHLMPGKVEKMEAHVGHTVQITGTMDAADKSSSSGGSGSGSASGTGAGAKGRPAMQHVTVTGMKHISATCS